MERENLLVQLDESQVVAPLSLGASLALLNKQKAEKEALEKAGPPLSLGATLLKLK